MRVEPRRVRLAVRAVDRVLKVFREAQDGAEWASLARLWLLEREAHQAVELVNLAEIFVEIRDGAAYSTRPWLARRLASFHAAAAHYHEAEVEITPELREEMRAGAVELERWLDVEDPGPFAGDADDGVEIEWESWAKERLR